MAKNKRVKQINEKGEVVKVWESILSVKKGGFNPNLVSKRCKRLKTEDPLLYEGYFWELDKTEEVKKVIKRELKENERIDKCLICKKEFIAELDERGVPYLRKCPTCRKRLVESRGRGIAGFYLE